MSWRFESNSLESRWRHKGISTAAETVVHLVRADMLGRVLGVMPFSVLSLSFPLMVQYGLVMLCG